MYFWTVAISPRTHPLYDFQIELMGPNYVGSRLLVRARGIYEAPGIAPMVDSDFIYILFKQNRKPFRSFNLYTFMLCLSCGDFF